VVESAFDLECFNFNVTGSVSSCHAANLNVKEKYQIMNPHSIDAQDEVKGLVIRNQTVYYMPKFTDLLAQRLQVLYIENCRLKVVSKKDLEQFPHLKYLSLTRNDLEVLDGDLFDFNLELEKMWLIGNSRLRFIEANLLDSLPKLWHANFVVAGCIDYYSSKPVNLQLFKEKVKNCNNPNFAKRLAPVWSQVFFVMVILTVSSW
jgi:Leucine rich repeat